MKMPFGLHKGTDTSVLPDDYLKWIAENLDLREPLRSAIAYEKNRRWYVPTCSVPQRAAINVPVEDLPLVRELIDSGYRAIARAHHPDTGGTTKNMVHLNAVIASLRQKLAGATR